VIRGCGVVIERVFSPRKIWQMLDIPAVTAQLWVIMSKDPQLL
jgi:hypothetical protein